MLVPRGPVDDRIVAAQGVDVGAGPRCRGPGSEASSQPVAAWISTLERTRSTSAGRGPDRPGPSRAGAPPPYRRPPGIWQASHAAGQQAHQAGTGSRALHPLQRGVGKIRSGGTSGAKGRCRPAPNRCRPRIALPRASISGLESRPRTRACGWRTASRAACSPVPSPGPRFRAAPGRAGSAASGPGPDGRDRPCSAGRRRDPTPAFGPPFKALRQSVRLACGDPSLLSHGRGNAAMPHLW